MREIDEVIEKVRDIRGKLEKFVEAREQKFKSLNEELKNLDEFVDKNFPGQEPPEESEESTEQSPTSQ